MKNKSIRQSEPFVIFDSKLIFDNTLLFLDDTQLPNTTTNDINNNNDEAKKAGKQIRHPKRKYTYKPKY